MLKITEKGQGLLIDFMLALFLFIIIWPFLLDRFDDRLQQDVGNNSIQLMRLKGDYVLETLVKTPGVPADWETKDVSEIGDVNSFGLSEQDRQISEAKLAAFSNYSSSYDLLKQKLGIGEYDFYFTFEGIDSRTAGLPVIGNADQVSTKRIVTYKGGVGTATLTLYRQN